MKFVNLTDYINYSNKCMNTNHVESAGAYKLKNYPGLIWASPARDDEFYCDWELAQPGAYKKFVEYYDISKKSRNNKT